MGLMTVALGMAMALRWRDTPGQAIARKLWRPAALSLVLGLLFTLLYGSEFSWLVLVGVTLAFWIVSTTAFDFAAKFNRRQPILQRLSGLPLSYYGMMLAHVGVAVTMTGITLVSIYSEEQDIRMMPGEQVAFAGYQFQFDGVKPVKGPNYRADQGALIVTRENQEVTRLYPEKRFYQAKQSIMTEAAIDAGLTRDIYVALGEPLPGGAWAVRLHYKPFVRWLWLGGLLMALGGFLAMADKRYRKRRQLKDIAYA